MIKETEKLQKEAVPYLQILEGKEVDGIRIYSDEAVRSIQGRLNYLELALGLQRRADNSVMTLASELNVGEANSPQEASQALTKDSLNRLNALSGQSGHKPKFFIALAGPGGAGKDTVFENATEELEASGVNVGRVSKYTTRDSSRPGAYHFRDGIEELHGDLGDICVTAEESERIKNTFGLDVVDNTVSLSQLAAIQSKVDAEDSTLTEWNFELDTQETALVEILYRKNRGWYATDGREIVSTLEGSDIAVITGNPSNLATMISWVAKTHPDIIPLMVLVLPAYPSQFSAAARALDRDGVHQSDKDLLSTTGPRQTDELEALVGLATSGVIAKESLVVLENDKLRSHPSVSGKVETEVGHDLALALQGKYSN